MNKDTFLQFITNSRNCGQVQLNTAINKGLHRARNDKFDIKKILKLVAACAFTFLMCITLNQKPFKAAAEGYYQNRNKEMPGSVEILDGYLNDIANNFKRFIGEE
jgi:hypothetical protein